MPAFKLLPALLLLAAATQPAPKPDPGAFPTFGITFTPPAGAAYELTDSPGDIAFYVFDAASPSKGTALFAEVMLANGKNVEDFAKELAANVGVPASPAPLQIAGKSAFRIEIPYRMKTFTRRNTYMIVHEDRVYMFSEFTSPGTSAAGPLEELLKTVKLTPPAAPIEHLNTFFDQSFNVFGKFSINGPRFLRRYQNTPGSINLGVRDFRAEADGLEPLHVAFNAITLPDPTPFANIRDRYSAGLVQQFGSPGPMTWEIHPTIPGLHISQPLLGTTRMPDGKTITLLNRYCLLELKPGEFIQIVFCVAPGKPEDDKAWADLSRKMLDTIKLEPAKQNP